MTLAKLKVTALATAAVVTVTATTIAIEKLATQSATETIIAQADTAPPVAQPDIAPIQPSITTGSSANLAAGSRDRVIVQKTAQPASRDDSAWLNIDSRVLSSLPPEFFIRPTQFPGQSSALVSSASSAQGQRLWGRALSMKALIAAAYGVPVSRTQFSTPEPGERFDAVMTVPNGSREMLQDEIKRQFGLVAKFAMQDSEVLAVKLSHIDAPGLKPSSQPDQAAGGGFAAGRTTSSSRTVVRSAQQSGSGGINPASRIGGNDYRVENGTIDGLLLNLQSHFDKTLYNATGLTNRYNIDLKWDPSSDAQNALQSALLEQLGLELAPGRAQVEMLVVQKAD